MDLVRKQLSAELAGIANAHILALCGAQYRRAIDQGPWEYEAPIKGLGIGQQLGWLTGRLAAE
ncbi:UNVERIFIED_ORG: hypothetical protein ABIB13_002234 [Arthrobacter sp. UYEF2]